MLIYFYYYGRDKSVTAFIVTLNYKSDIRVMIRMIVYLVKGFYNYIFAHTTEFN